MTNDEALALERGDRVSYNGRDDWTVVALFGRGGAVRYVRLACANMDTYARPHKITLIRRTTDDRQP